MSKKTLVVTAIANMIGDKATAEMVVDMLQQEGWLKLGYGDSDIDQIITKFSETYGTTKVSNYDRFAANRLAKRYSAQAVCGIIDLLAAAANEPYVPVVNNVTELEKKWVSVLNFVRKNKGTETIMV